MSDVASAVTKVEHTITHLREHLNKLITINQRKLLLKHPVDNGEGISSLFLGNCDSGGSRWEQKIPY